MTSDTFGDRSAVFWWYESLYCFRFTEFFGLQEETNHTAQNEAFFHLTWTQMEGLVSTDNSFAVMLQSVLLLCFFLILSTRQPNF